MSESEQYRNKSYNYVKKEKCPFDKPGKLSVKEYLAQMRKWKQNFEQKYGQKELDL